MHQLCFPSLASNRLLIHTLKDARDQYLEAIANGIQQLGVPLATFFASTEIAERIDSVPVAELASTVVKLVGFLLKKN